MGSLGVHDGTFHADEVTAAALLILFGLVDQHQIVRTRDHTKLNACEFVCDVGGIFAPDKKRFDHHQSDYNGHLSSAGMILNYLRDTNVIEPALHQFLAEHLIDGIDAIDNGNYTSPIGHCTFSAVVSEFIPVKHDASRQALDAAFFEALTFVKRHLNHMLERFAYIQEAKAIVDIEMQKGDEVLYFDQSLPWLDSFFELGGEMHPAKFIVMPSGEHWKLRGIPPSYERRMEVRVPLPEKWAGLLADDLKSVSGIEGAIFCHKGRFISIWKTREDALNALEVVLGKNGF